MKRRKPLPSASVNGHGPAKLIKLLEYHQRCADAIRVTLDLLADHSATSSTDRAGTTITTAIALDAVRRARAPKSTGGNWREHKTAARQRTAERLATLDTHEPRPFRGHGVGPLMLSGYIKRKGKGWIRTSKEYTP